MIKPTPKPSPTAGKDELASLLHKLKWSGLELKRRVGVSPASVYKWLKGETRVPGSVLAYLRLLALLRELGV